LIDIKLYGPLREVVRQTEMDTKDQTAAQVLTQLCKKYPKLKPLMFDESGKFYSHYVILLNGENVWALKGMDTLVPDQSQISLVYPIEGG